MNIENSGEDAGSRPSETNLSVMRAIVGDRYGRPEVLELREVAIPVPDADRVQIRVEASSLNTFDLHMITGTPYMARMVAGFTKPKRPIPGADVAGVVVHVGENVSGFAVGDEVFGDVGFGAFAEYASVNPKAIAAKPSGVSFEQAAAVPLAGLTALQGLRDIGGLRAGQRVIVNGASGGVGTFAVQIAKARGPEVAGVCSTRNVDLVRSIGSDHVIDYTEEDFTRSGRRYDLILDNVGNRTLAQYRRVLAPNGMYLASFGQSHHTWLGPTAKLLRMMVLSRFVSRRMVLLAQHRKKEDIDEIRDLLAAGTAAPVIDRTYPLADTVDALHYLEGGHARGKVVITI